MSDLPPRRKRPGAPGSGGQKRKRPPEGRSRSERPRSDRPRSRNRGSKGGNRSRKKSSGGPPTGAIIGGIAGVAVLGVVVALVMFGPSVGSLAAFADSYESIADDTMALMVGDLTNYMEASMKGEDPPISAETLGNRLEKLALRRIRIGPISKTDKEAMEKKIEEKWKDEKEAVEERQKKMRDELREQNKGEGMAAFAENMKKMGEVMKALGSGFALFGTADRALIIPDEGKDDHDRIQARAITIIQELAPTLADIESVSAANSRHDTIKKALADMEALQKELETLGEDSKSWNESSSKNYMSLGLANSSLLRALRERIEEKAPGTDDVEKTLRDLSLAYSKVRSGRPSSGTGSSRTSTQSSTSSSQGTSGSINTTPNDVRVKNNMKQIMLAMHNHHNTKRQMPRAGDGPNANEGLSWRVHLLPYLELKPLYDQFHLDEPWDSPHNKTLIDKMPDIYKGVGTGGKGKSTIHVFAGEGRFFNLEKPHFRFCTDGTSNTLAIVDASFRKADTWTKPGGLTLTAGDAKTVLGETPKGFYVVGLMDGKVLFLKDDAPESFFQNLVKHNDGQVIGGNFQKYLQ